MKTHVDRGEPLTREEEEKLLSRDEAFEFLEKIGVVNGREQIQGDSLAFLNAIIGGFMTHLPFQSVSMIVPEEERHVPSLEEVVKACVNLEGGACFVLNTFMCILLRTLGLSSHVLDGVYSASHFPHCHVVVRVNNLRYPDDDYIVDVGTGYPFQEAVSLVNLPITLHHAGLEYRYTRDGDTVKRLQRSGDHPPPGEKSVMVGDWRQVFHFSLTPVHYEFFFYPMRNIYINSESDFLTKLRAVRFPSVGHVPKTSDNDAQTRGRWKSDTGWADSNAGLGRDTGLVGERVTGLERESTGSRACVEPDSAADVEGETATGVERKNLADVERETAIGVFAGAEGDVSSSSAGDAGSGGPPQERQMLAVTNQSLLIGPMNQVLKVKIVTEDWADVIKRHFPNLPHAKVDAAVRTMMTLDAQQ